MCGTMKPGGLLSSPCQLESTTELLRLQHRPPFESEAESFSFGKKSSVTFVVLLLRLNGPVQTFILCSSSNLNDVQNFLFSFLCESFDTQSSDCFTSERYSAARNIERADDLRRSEVQYFAKENRQKGKGRRQEGEKGGELQAKMLISEAN